MVVQYILKNREMFEPFIEDDVPFEEYCKTMDNDGTWAGHMELQAASLVTRSNICIHQNMSPRWYISNFDQPGACMIHLSYHDEEHYNSVRLKEDTRDGPARPITIKADSNLSSSSCQAIAGSNKSKSGAGKDITDAGSIKLVMAGCGCENIEKVEQTLLQMDGDVDAAIEYLIAEQGIEDFAEETVWSPCNTDASHGDDANGNSEEQRKEPVEETYKENPPGSSAKRNHDGGSAQREDKEMQKIPRNEACPCGSKKKYRSCCGSGTGKISAISNDQALESRKSRKEKKRGKRGSDTSALSIGSDGGPPDVGALCI
ncbi:OVARIAN TUMOR DOMAIN-containing deubiquitinating enzyme 7-like isoform X2 [Eucalyptus grandis]|uniref:OVARIAN TUMOR DOMAIN-containing deubiquitinating enzyme 7-like isoform X2 n=2 Tax=Eucalyptus grandis TaxID=71139 RepID=UPI00192EB8FD|nr:OVARIAN TUMOR DOMAIN-containing deubiquitinating enzyme 7-like isoform X2 [Eucalyptus grandis]